MEQLRADVDRLLVAVYGEPDEGGVMQGGIMADLRHLDRSVRVLTTSNELATRQISEAVVMMRDQQRLAANVMDKLHDHDGRIDSNAAALQQLLGKVDENTAIIARSVAMAEQVLKSTASIAGTVATIQDMQAAGRLGVRLARWARSGIVWLAAVAGAAVALWNYWPKHKAPTAAVTKVPED